MPTRFAHDLGLQEWVELGAAGLLVEVAGAGQARRDSEAQRAPAGRTAEAQRDRESIFWTLKDHLGCERHRARTLHGLRARIASKLLAYSAGIWLNWLLGRPTRTFADLTA